MATTEEKQHCPSCNGERVVFHQKYSTFPGTDNEIRHYHDVLCSACGMAIVHEYVDETPEIKAAPKTEGLPPQV